MATNSKQVKPLDIPFKEFMPGQVIQSVQFNDDMRDIEDTVNELVNEHNIVSTELSEHVDNLNNPHQVDAHQTGTYNATEIDEFFQDVKSGNLNDNAITNRVLDDDCVTARNIEDNTITVSKVDSMLGSQLDISQNIEIATRYTKEETDNLIQEKVGNGTYSKEQLDVKFEEVQAGVIVDSIIGIEKLKEDVGKKLNISGNINILNRYTKDEVDYLIKTNALPHDWGSVLDEVDNDVLPFLDTRNGIFPVADYMIADKFVSPSDQILDFDIREVVESRGEHETLNDRLNVYDTIKPEISVELDAITNKINDNQKINNDEHDIIDNKIVENKNNITALNDRMFNLENNVSGNNSKISNLERRADSLESRATALESADRGINIKISNVENRLGNIDTLNNTQTSKINTLENRANTTDTYISNINTNINTVNNDLNNVKSDLDTVKEDLSNVGQIVNENIEPIRTELSQAVSKNNEQDNRLSSIENDLNGLPDVISNHNDILEKHKSEINDIKYVNKRQDVMIGGLFNENADGRLNIDGEGNDVKLEGSKDGLVEIKNAVGNTLVNCAKDGEKEFTLNGDINESGIFVTTTEGVDNGLVDVVCEGNTLVNLLKDLRASDGWVDNGNKFSINIPTGSGQPMILGYFSYELKKDTVYTVILNVVEYTTGIPHVCFMNKENNILASTTEATTSSIGLKKFKLTTKSDIDSSILRILPRNGIDNTYSIGKDILILEGDWTDKEIPPYFEGMKSVGQDDESGHKIEILSQNKNLCENSNYVNYAIGGDGGNQYFYSRGCQLYIVHVKENTKYSISKEGGDRFVVASHNGIPKANQHVKILTTAQQGVFRTSVTTPVGHDTLLVYVSSNITNDLATNIQVEEGNVNTSYVPHSLNKKEILLNEPLRAVGDVKDRFVQIDGKWYIERNCGSYTTSGNEGWTRNYQLIDTNGYYAFKTNLPNCKMGNTWIPLMTDNFMSIYGDNGSSIIDLMDRELACIHGWSFGFTICINGNKLSSIDEVGFKQWLVNNPVTVIYPLASPTYEPLEVEPTLLTYTDVTHITNNSTIPCVMNVKNSGYECILKPNTKYTVLGVDNGRIGTSTILNGTITTPATIDDNVLRPYGTGNCNNVMLLEGEPANIPGYFKGIKSVFEDQLITEGENAGKYACEVKVVGKNKFDKTKVISGKLINNANYNYSISNNSGYSIIVYECNSDTPITISALSNFALARWEDLEGYLIKGETASYGKTKAILTPPLKRCILKICVANDVLDSNVQIEEGTQATPYESYKEYVQTLYLDEPLYKDNELCVHDGKLGYWKNWDKVVLDGSENWIYSATMNNLIEFRFIFNNKEVPSIVYPSINDKFTNYDVNYLEKVVIFSKNLYILIHKAKLSTQDVAGFKQYLSQNPVTVVYQLAEPVFVPILENTPQWVLESFNDCSIHFNTNIPIISSNLSYTGNVPSVYSMQRTNQIQDDLIDVSLMATDEMFMMLEPLLTAIPQILNEKGNSKMVDMYVAMVMRGLKTIEEIPARYREEVKKVLDKLEK